MAVHTNFEINLTQEPLLRTLRRTSAARRREGEFYSPAWARHAAVPAVDEAEAPDLAGTRDVRYSSVTMNGARTLVGGHADVLPPYLLAQTTR